MLKCYLLVAYRGERLSGHMSSSDCHSFSRPRRSSALFSSSIRGVTNFDLLPDDANNKDLAKRLLLRADGTFQWSRLMIVHLKSHPSVLQSHSPRDCAILSHACSPSA